MIHVRLSVALTLRGPVLTQATSAGMLGLDAMMARDARQRPLLPYSLVRGKLRQSLEELVHVLPDPEARQVRERLVRWFGPRHDADDFTNQRGGLFLMDFVHATPRTEGAGALDNTDSYDGQITRVRIDPETGAAEEKMLMMLESPFRPGELAEFQGEMWCVCPNVSEVKETMQILRAGFHWLPQLGAERTVGFGRTASVRLACSALTGLAPRSDPPTPDIDAEPDSQETDAGPIPTVTFPPQRRAGSSSPQSPSSLYHGVRIHPRSLLCLGGQRQNANLFESNEVLPGNAILGALATTLRMASSLPLNTNEVGAAPGGPWPALSANFSRIRFTHAFPAMRDTNRRPSAIPLSLVAAEPWSSDIPDDLDDVALCTRPRRVPHGFEQRPPVFQSDWKQHVVTVKTRQQFGWPAVRKELRVRTAIDPDRMRASDEQLFAYEAVDPSDLDWLGTLDLSRVAENDREQVFHELQCLLFAGLGPLGKTKIDAAFEFLPADSIQPTVPSDAQPLNGNLWTITLQTPAILCGPDDLRDDELTIGGTGSSATRLLEGYGRTFDRLSGGALRLEHFFARQSLLSSFFAGRRPLDRHGNYYPFVATEQGSTFLLRATGDAAAGQSLIEDWLRHGLPLESSLASGIGRGGFDPNAVDAWKHCPILDRHGFGEIVVNPPWIRQPGVRLADWPITLEDEA